MSGVVVAGATGGCGVTTLACAMALRAVQDGAAPILVGAGADPGGPSDLWGVPTARTLDDLLPLGNDLGPAHVAHVIHAHVYGAGIIVGPRSPDAAVAWQGDPLRSLISGITDDRDWIADVGRAGTALADALAARADLTVIVVTARVDAVAHAARLIDRLGVSRVAAVMSPIPAAGDLSARAMRRALGDIPVVDMPSDGRGAADVIAGRMPSRRGLARSVTELAGQR